ncbi:acyl-CoA N-acyltransferase [Papiliotrema laurentii]|uniref:Acyl-CoA N-acyltransferase n=1 Tax=Papiliotrema laurentii TaxID=5418 RepID=A0AAD9L8H3_PAPLA|nr:acyl-CoA N-acyltransferase [Papiliotrema laurentii]
MFQADGLAENTNLSSLHPQIAMSGVPPYTLKVAKTKDEIEAAYDIRLEVFSVEQGFPVETEIDEYDPVSVHFLLTTPIPSPPDTTVQSLLPDSLTPNRPHPSTTQKPIGTIRLVPDLGKVGRLVVDKEYRKYGFGKVLLCAVDDYIQGLNEEERAVMKGIIREEEGQKVAQLKLHAQMQVIPFYAKFGYRPVGEPFDEDGAPHQKMVKDLVLS